jgi:diaminopimelate decarboxylase/aspartate kinase
MSDPTRFVILKFGGTSVSSPSCWETIAKTLRDRLSEGLRPVVVCSALSQVSNELERALERALQGEDPADAIARLRGRHVQLAADLGVDVDAEIEAEIERLAERLTGASLLREASPRVQAEVLAAGEMLATRIGAAWLDAQGLATHWLDARGMLGADEQHGDPHRQFLSAACREGADDALAARLAALPEAVLLTQGFVVGAPDGGTALLGRGGSDTSATSLGERLRAQRVEIWTDVPGLFSADPRVVPDARRLSRVAFDEVMELTTRGAKVLHPRSLAPAQRAGIPIHIRCTREPADEGTVIGEPDAGEQPAAVAISSRLGMAVVAMNVESSWQEVGVISELAGHFARHGLSIDAISSSQTRVTVSLDASANSLDEARLRDLLADLEQCSEPQLIAPVASVSIVGRRLRYALPRLPSMLGALDDHPVHLLAHAANDRSLTFVIDEDGADDIVRRLHRDLLASDESSSSRDRS